MGIVCQEDLDFMACLFGESNDLLNTCDVSWFKFNDGATTKNMYGDAIPGFDPVVVLKGACQFDVQEESLSKYGTQDRGVENDNIERPDVIVELARYDSVGAARLFSNSDEYEIRGLRYHCIGLKEPDDPLIADAYVILYLLQKQ